MRCKPKRSRTFAIWLASCLGIARVARERLHRDRAALGVGEQPEHDLRPIGLAITRINGPVLRAFKGGSL
jgi:hypothetical protein